MKKSMGLWIWITSIIIIRLQVISSTIICMKLKTINRVCKTNEGKLIPYKPEYVDLKNDPGESVEYRDSAINIIYDFVFTDSHFYRKTKSLKLRLSNRNLIISPLAFRLSELEHLEITPGSVMLDPKTFQRLNHLKSLKLRINDAIVRLYQVLPNFQNLESLELIEYKFESICDPSNTDLYISSLNYTASIINKLSSGSFRCLPNLESLIITRTNLSVIEVGAFENLKNLERLELTSNWQITSIPGNFLHELTNLKILNLANNSILKIDSEAFAPMNKNCKMLNLSYNFLEFLEYGCFKNFECETVDLGGNNIQYIGSSEFKNSIIIRLFLDDNIIDKFNNKRRWGLQTSTAVYFKYNHDESATTTNKNYTHCYESDQDIYVICKNTKYISSVTQKVLPYRLLPTTLAIYDNETWGIDPEAFVDLSIETLTIKSSADTFYVRENSFMNMKKLKNLQLMTCLVILSEGSFLSLKDTLESLTLSVYEYDVYLCEVLLMLKKLKVLIIENNLAFHFHRCGAYNNSNYITVENLRYNGGSFKTVPSKSFESLKMLYHLAIHESSLEEISAGAFSGLENLRILNIQFNTNLTFIKKGVLDGLQKLDILLLMHNSISVIEDIVFMDLNKTVSLLDLSGNKIQSITQKTFEGVFIGQLDLANNQIMHYDEQYMKDGTLYIFNNNKIIYKDDSKVTKIQSSCHFQGLLIICVEDNVMTFVSLNQNLLDPDIELSDLRKSSIDIPIEIQVNNISSIDKKAWIFMNKQYYIKTLIIYKDNENKFTFEERSLEPLKKLQSLELNIGPITLKSNHFKNLELLRSLAIQVDEKKTCLSRSFVKLVNLRGLEIFKNDSVGICNNLYTHMLPPLNKLLYSGGSIIILHSKSLICLPKLSIFKITATNLATLEEDAFFGLDNLLTINLSHNNLTHIPNNVFNKLDKLNKLTLHHNSIKTIEMGALVLNHAMKIVNISNNQLERITAGTFKGMICDYLDLSGNTILSHDRNILDFTEIKKSNINGRVSTRGHATKYEDPPINNHYVGWTNWGVGCDGKLTYGYKYGRRTCPVVVFRVGWSKQISKYSSSEST